MIAELKKLLSECHMKAGDKTVKILGNSNFNYLVARMKEELDNLETVDPDDGRLKLIIQLATIARYKLKPKKEKPLSEVLKKKEAKAKEKGFNFPEGQP